SLIVELGDVQQALETAWAEISARHEQRSVNPERPLLAPDDAFVARADLRTVLQQRTAIVCPPEGTAGFADDAPAIDFACAGLPQLSAGSDDATGKALRAFYDDFAGRILVTGASAGRREAMRDWMTGLGLAPARCDGWAEFLDYDKAVTVTSAILETGVVLPDTGI